MSTSIRIWSEFDPNPKLIRMMRMRLGHERSTRNTFKTNSMLELNPDPETRYPNRETWILEPETDAWLSPELEIRNPETRNLKPETWILLPETLSFGLQPET